MLFLETQIERLKNVIETADAIVIGAGSGLSDSGEFSLTKTYFEEFYSRLTKGRGSDELSFGNYLRFPSEEYFWAFWSRYISLTRYRNLSVPVYRNLYKLVRKKEHFIVTTNADHSFHKAGFDEHRIFSPQGDLGFLQCSVPCHEKTYSNETLIQSMMRFQESMRIPDRLLPRCPRCGKPMTINYRSNENFVRDESWYQSAERYDNFMYKYQGKRVLFLELGVDYKTPEIIKYPFRIMTAMNRNAIYACINMYDSTCPMPLAKRSICIQDDIGTVIERLLKQNE